MLLILWIIKSCIHICLSIFTYTINRESILLKTFFVATLISHIIFISSNHPVGNTVANAERIRAFETYMILQYNKWRSTQYLHTHMVYLNTIVFTPSSHTLKRYIPQLCMHIVHMGIYYYSSALRMIWDGLMS